VPFPFVAVTLPPDTPPAYTAALLEACTQAYGEGDCRTAPGTTRTAEGQSPGDTSAPSAADSTASPAPSTVSPTSEPTAEPLAADSLGEPRILATVGWQDDLRAEVFLGMPHWINSRWIEWHLAFKEQDQLVERHRAVGFALGRLAATVAEVAQREREGQQAENKEVPSRPKPTESPAPPLQTPPTDSTPTVLVKPLPAPLELEDEAPDTESSVFSAALLGAELGTGFRGVRIGGAAGFELTFDNRFVLGLRGHLTGDTFHATFAGAEILGGIVWEPGPIEIQLSFGGGWNYVSARVDKTAFEHVVGGVGSLGFALSGTAISPFLNFGASLLQEGINTNVAGLNAFGPVVPRLQLGIKFRPGLL
jgi:hypothetical protein